MTIESIFTLPERVIIQAKLNWVENNTDLYEFTIKDIQIIAKELGYQHANTGKFLKMLLNRKVEANPLKEYKKYLRKE